MYSGSDVEQAGRAIHRVQAALYTLYPPEELAPEVEHVEAVIAELPEQAALLKLATNLASSIGVAAGGEGSGSNEEKGSGKGKGNGERKGNGNSNGSGSPHPVTQPGTMLRGIYERATDVSDNLQRQARGLRNALVVASVATAIVLVALGLAHVIHKNIIDVCPHEGVCPSGKTPHSLDVFVIELAGMLGGLLSIVIPLATGERIKTPYGVFFQQLIFKMLAGAATAVGGLLLIESGVIETIKLQTTTAILGYAVVLGFAQQIATGAIDRTANSLAKQTPTAKSV